MYAPLPDRSLLIGASAFCARAGAATQRELVAAAFAHARQGRRRRRSALRRRSWRATARSSAGVRAACASSANGSATPSARRCATRSAASARRPFRLRDVFDLAPVRRLAERAAAQARLSRMYYGADATDAGRAMIDHVSVGGERPVARDALLRGGARRHRLRGAGRARLDRRLRQEIFRVLAQCAARDDAAAAEFRRPHLPARALDRRGRCVPCRRARPWRRLRRRAGLASA